jgi:hypothetical protein
MKINRLLAIFVLFIKLSSCIAREGMWLPLLVEQLNYSEIQAAGFKLSADEIYSINQASLKDAIVLFGRGCTGGIVSGKGLLFTNHHCGAGYIASHSTVEKNYLVNGFWAMNQQEEIPNPGLTVKFLVQMIDVTDSILKNIPDGTSYQDEKNLVAQRISAYESAVEDTSDCSAIIESFYAGNNYYLFLYSEYSDVRLVGAPPENMASFGGDIDNWVWPRHSADFSVFRIYTSPDGKPAKYSPDNVPLETKRFLPISLQGVKEGDFTLVMGFPGQTFEYLYSGELENLKDSLYPLQIKLRSGRIKIIDESRKADESLYLKYASEKSGISNSYKKWKGVLYGFNRFNVIEKRQEYEKYLLDIAGPKKNELLELYLDFNESYTAYKPYAYAMNCFSESVFAVKPFKFCGDVYSALNTSFPDKEAFRTKLAALARKNFKDFDWETEKKLTEFMLVNFKNQMPAEYIPELLKRYTSEQELSAYLEKEFSTSVFTDSSRFKKAMKQVLSGKKHKFLNDPYMQLYQQILEIYSLHFINGFNATKSQYESLYHQYIPLIRSIDTCRKFYPDANLTMRITYGKVGGYSPSDAIDYSYQTYLDGLFEKKNQRLPEYSVPEKLEPFYIIKDYGIYADSQGRLPLCFIASNHTSGGNSGSPVLNSEGQLIGLNFDRTWESTMSDFYFDESICRNIAVDSRYILFIIDKYAGAGYLLKEMEIEGK